MNKIKMFCLSMNPNHLQLIKKLNYEPVGLGNSSFSEEWMSDKSGTNISHKNSFYGEYTFHYWLWKNYLNNLPNNWIGFCQYRKFWISENILKNDLEFHELNSITLKDISKEYNNYDSILGTPFYVNQFRFSKFVKNNFKKMFFSPSLLLDKRKRNIRFHFDMMHGDGNLDQAIDLLDKTGNNISNKNKFYGEYTFHYWLWKNYIDKLDDKLIGFCQYRTFWTTTKSNTVSNDFLLIGFVSLIFVPNFNLL